MLWEIADTPHRLLGSAHVLPAETVFPNWVAASHDGIERFIFESGGAGSPHGFGIDSTQAHLKLAGVSAAYQSAKALLASIGIYDSIDDLLPWALTFHIVARFLPVLGASPIYGVEHQLKNVAELKGIKIDFLESSTRSTELIDLSCKEANGGLSFLEQTIAGFSSGECLVQMRRLVNAWLSSDLVEFNAILNENLIKCPYIFNSIIKQRNREWGTAAKRFSADKSPTLFVVGCLHTVGSDSFIEQMKANGLRLNFIA